MGVGEPHALRRQAVEVGRSDAPPVRVVAANVPITEIVSVNHHDVGPGRRPFLVCQDRSDPSNRDRKQKGEQTDGGQVRHLKFHREENRMVAVRPRPAKNGIKPLANDRETRTSDPRIGG